MKHFHLHLSNDPVAGAAGRAIINAKLKARLFRLDVCQYQGFSTPGTGRSQLARFLCAVSHGYSPALFHVRMRLLNSTGWIRKYRNNIYFDKQLRPNPGGASFVAVIVRGIIGNPRDDRIIRGHRLFESAGELMTSRSPPEKLSARTDRVRTTKKQACKKWALTFAIKIP